MFDASDAFHKYFQYLEAVLSDGLSPSVALSFSAAALPLRTCPGLVAYPLGFLYLPPPWNMRLCVGVKLRPLFCFFVFCGWCCCCTYVWWSPRLLYACVSTYLYVSVSSWVSLLQVSLLRRIFFSQHSAKQWISVWRLCTCCCRGWLWNCVEAKG